SPPHISTLSLHDALPILQPARARPGVRCLAALPQRGNGLQPRVARNELLWEGEIKFILNPNGVVPVERQEGATPLGLATIKHAWPRVASRTRQPWAEGRNAVGVLAWIFHRRCHALCSTYELDPVQRSTSQNEVSYEIHLERAHSIFARHHSHPHLQRGGQRRNDPVQSIAQGGQRRRRLREKMQEVRQDADGGGNRQGLSVRAGTIRDRVARGPGQDQTQEHESHRNRRVY